MTIAVMSDSRDHIWNVRKALEAQRSQRKTFFFCQALPEGHEHFSLPASQRQRKKIPHLCVLCVSAVNYVPFDFHRFEADLH